MCVVCVCVCVFENYQRYVTTVLKDNANPLEDRLIF